MLSRHHPDNSIALDESDAELRRAERERYALQVRRLASALVHGLDPSPFHGSGVDYAHSRPYASGDDLRRLDWRASARTGRPFIKEYEALKRLPVWICTDTSASMQVGSGTVTKADLALVLTGALGISCQERGNPVGLLGLSTRMVRLAATGSRQRLWQGLSELNDYHPAEGTAFDERLGHVPRQTVERSIFVVISDLHDPGAIDSLKRLHVAHDVVVLHLLDPSEEGLARGGIIRAREAETGQRQVMRLKQPEASGRRAENLHALRVAGIDSLTLRCDQEVAAPLHRFLAGRGGLLRRVR